jgi:hypothetical protein
VAFFADGGLPNAFPGQLIPFALPFIERLGHLVEAVSGELMNESLDPGRGCRSISLQHGRHCDLNGSDSRQVLFGTIIFGRLLTQRLPR